MDEHLEPTVGSPGAERAGELTLGSTLRLNNGVEIPRFGLGVYRSQPGQETRAAVLWALEAGYRHIDTARVYGNERDVGIALRESGVRREQVFVTTKLWNDDQGYEKTLRACERSLKRLELDYLDLYLIHWPVQGVRGDSWRALVHLQREGRCRAIGVSNYMTHHLVELLAETEVVPQVNQVEMNPFLPQREVRALCRQHGIAVEAYSPLTKGWRLDEPALAEVARRHRKTPAQVLIRWALEQDTIVIPKSVRRARIHENADVFDFALTPEDHQALATLEEDLHTGWDPTHAP